MSLFLETFELTSVDVSGKSPLTQDVKELLTPSRLRSKRLLADD